MTITAMNRAAIADAIARGDDARLGSVGTAQLAIELRIADADDRELAAGEIGEILVRGPTVMRGYWSNPDATKSDARERLAAHRRCRQPRRRRLPDADRPLEGSHHQRRVEHLSARSRGGAAAASRRRRGRGRRPRARRLGRGSRRLRRRPGRGSAGAVNARTRSSARWTRGASIASRGSSGRRRMWFVAELPKNNTGKVLKTELRKRAGGARRRCGPSPRSADRPTSQRVDRRQSQKPLFSAAHHRGDSPGQRTSRATMSHAAASAMPMASIHNVGRIPILSASAAPVSAPAGVSRPVATCHVAAARPSASGGSRRCRSVVSLMR